MADAIEMNAMYQRLGFTASASALLSGAQGMDEIYELSLLTYNEFDALYKLVWSPGGTILDPVSRSGGTIPAPGCGISMRAITNMKLVCYFIRHQTRTSRACTHETVTLGRIRVIRALKASELFYTLLTDNVTIHGGNWLKTLEFLSLWISDHLGVTKTPPGSLLRSNEAPPADPDHPMGQEGWQYASYHEEMLARCP